MKNFKHLGKTHWMIMAAAIIFIAGFIFAHDRGYLKNSFSIDSKKAVSQNDTAEKIRQYCADPANAAKALGKESCYSKQFRAMAKQTGPVPAFTALHKLQSIDQTTIGCHLIAHGIGWGTYEHHPDSWQQDIRTIDAGCNYGAPHGIIEAYLSTQPDHTLTKEILPQLCGENPRADCNHIVGHLTLVETRADVPKALDYCDVFKDVRQLDFCYTGVFMEYQTALNLIEHGFAPKEWLNWPARVPELEKMCRSYDGQKAIDCWMEIVHAALVKFNNDPKSIFDFCSSSQVLEGATRCKRHSIGIIAAAKNFDLANLKSMCDLQQAQDPNFKADCYVQLAASTMSTVPNQQDKVKQFCESLASEYRQSCLGQVSGYTEYNQNSND